MTDAQGRRRVLVTGGQGYIGRHVVARFLAAGHTVVSLDRPGKLSRVRLEGETPVGMDLVTAGPALEALLREQSIGQVLHLAALTEVGESLRAPMRYYHQNLTGTLSLLAAMEAAGVRELVFASSAAVYGDPGDVVLRESSPLRPVNPYGASKLLTEQILDDLVDRGRLAAISLRLFNVMGTAQDAGLPEVEQSLGLIFPLLLTVSAERRAIRPEEYHRAGVLVRGYATPDGTVLRDYVHATDVAEAFLRASHAVAEGKAFGHYNIATGVSYSIDEVVAAVRAHTGQSLDLGWQPPQVGFPAILKADVTAAREQLGFTARLRTLAELLGGAPVA